MKINIFFNKTIRFIYRHYKKCIWRICTAFELLYLYAIGVKIGDKMSFIGWTSFFLEDDSHVSIGQDCMFISDGAKNHIGINHRCIIATHNKEAVVSIGDRVGMSGSTINCWNSITIGDDVRIGANCTIMDSDFHVDDPRVSEPRPIVIKDGAWIGANVVVMKGVTIGKNAVIGMNSVVTKDIEDDAIAAGVPCKTIRINK